MSMSDDEYHRDVVIHAHMCILFTRMRTGLQRWLAFGCCRAYVWSKTDPLLRSNDLTTPGTKEPITDH